MIVDTHLPKAEGADWMFYVSIFSSKYFDYFPYSGFFSAIFNAP